ncbi:MAG: PEGA domain-containing protein [Polyangiaceae bacterium]
MTRTISIVACVLAFSTPVWAEGEAVERAKASFKAGATAYAAGEYLAAIQALDAAYALTPIPAIAFSLAQAERKQYFVGHDREHLDRAVKLFRRYIEQVPIGGRRSDALDALAQLEPLALTPSTESRSSSAADSVRKTRLMIMSESPGAAISIDGDSPLPSPRIREVEPGKHRIDVSAEGFFPDQRELTAVAGDLIPEVVTLRERPSTVNITAPSGAEIYIDGAYVRHGGDNVVIELSSGRHRLAVAESGHRVSAQTLDLERGKTVAVSVDLEQTGQRKAANVLFITGAGALVASAVFSAFAISAEDRAQDFLVRQARGNVTSGDLAEYDDDLATRERFRVANGVSIMSAAGLFITGFFLYQFDRPASEDIHRPSSEPQKRPANVLSSVKFAPMAAPTNVGATLRMTF